MRVFLWAIVVLFVVEACLDLAYLVRGERRVVTGFTHASSVLTYFAFIAWALVLLL